MTGAPAPAAAGGTPGQAGRDGRRRRRRLAWAALLPWRLLRDLGAGLLTGIALLLAVGLWRLASGPVPLDALVPELEAALQREGVAVTIQGAALDWRPGAVPFAVRLDGVVLADEAGAPVASLPVMHARLDLPALLAGEVRLRSLIVARPELVLERLGDGQLVLRETGTQAADPQPWDGAGNGAEGGAGIDMALIAGLMGETAGTGAAGTLPDALAGVLAQLDRVVLTGGVLRVEDRVAGRRWRIEGVEAVLVPERDGATVEADGRLVLAGSHVDIAGQARADVRAGRVTLSLSAAGRGVEIAGFAGVDPRLGFLAGVEGRAALDVVGEVEIAIADGVAVIPGPVGFDIATGPLLVPTGEVLPAPMSLGAARLRGLVDPRDDTARLDRLEVDLGGPVLVLSGEVGPPAADGRRPATVEGRLDTLPVDLLHRLWPLPLEPGGRAWVTRNLSQGMIRHGTAAMALTLAADPFAEAPALPDGGTVPASAVEVESLSATLALEGMRVAYMDGLPPIVGVDGEVRIDLDAVEITTWSGSTQGLRVPEGRMRIYGFDRPDTLMDIDVAVAGPLAAVLALLDRPRLGYASALGLRPQAASGRAGVRLRFTFPLLDDLGFDRVALAAAANIQDGGLGEVEPGITVSGIDGRLDLTAQGLTLAGRGAVNGVPVDFAWRESFLDGPDPSVLEIAGSVSAAQRQRLGLDTRPWIAGPVGIEARLVDHDRVNQSLTATLDLTGAELALDGVDYRKPPGEPAGAELAMSLQGHEPVAIERLSLSAPALALEGALRFAGDGAPLLIDLTRIAFREHRLAARLSRPEDGRLMAELRGGFVDLGALLGEDVGLQPFGGGRDEAQGNGAQGNGAQGNGAQGDATQEDGEAAGIGDLGSLTATLDFDTVDLPGGGRMHGVTGLVVFDGTRWQRIDMAGATARGGRLELYWAWQGDDLAIEAAVDDMGAALADLALTDGVEGGRFAASLRSTGPAGDADLPPLAGVVAAERFRVRDAPALARLISALSIGGLQALFESEGLLFDRAELAVDYDGSVLRMDQGRAYGGALGLRLDGVLNLTTRSIEAYGTIVPVHGVNNALSAIPLLGDVLTGSSGGIFAFTYSLRGPLSGPEVSVNPLSVLAPGFLRDIFFLGETDEAVSAAGPREVEADLPGGRPDQGR